MVLRCTSFQGIIKKSIPENIPVTPFNWSTGLDAAIRFVG